LGFKIYLLVPQLFSFGGKEDPNKIMYKQYSKNRNSMRSFNRGSFSNGNFSRGRNNFPRKIKTISTRDPNIFIKKASENAFVQTETEHKSFSDFSISNPLKFNIQGKGYTTPTPIQDQAIEPILEGKDLIGLASTGTGKTAAFLIPIVDKIFKFRNQNAIIIAPTKELAIQINEELKSFVRDMKIYSCLVIGGANMYRQIHEIKRNPHVVVGTPGRLKDLIKRDVLMLEDFSIFVLDEVDLMVDIGFIHDINFFISQLPTIRQSLFFSATIPPKVNEILRAFVKDPVTVSVKLQETSENVTQDVVRVSNPLKKLDILHDLLIKDGFDKVLIFGRTKHGVEKLDRQLNERGFKTGALHGNKNMGYRKRVLESFKRNEIKILLATDVASRGLDIDGVSHVINYELPETYDDYIHRIGRTGRAGKTGTALTFIDSF